MTAPQAKKQFYVWSTADGTLLKTVATKGENTTGMDFSISEKGDFIATCAWGGGLQLYNATGASRKGVRDFDKVGAHSALAQWGPCNTLIATPNHGSARRGFHVYDMQLRQQTHHVEWENHQVGNLAPWAANS